MSPCFKGLAPPATPKFIIVSGSKRAIIKTAAVEEKTLPIPQRHTADFPLDEIVRPDRFNERIGHDAYKAVGFYFHCSDYSYHKRSSENIIPFLGYSSQSYTQVSVVFTI